MHPPHAIKEHKMRGQRIKNGSQCPSLLPQEQPGSQGYGDHSTPSMQKLTRQIQLGTHDGIANRDRERRHMVRTVLSVPSCDQRNNLRRLPRLDPRRNPDRRFKRTSRKQIPSCLGAFSGEVFEAVFRADAAKSAFVRERKWHPSQRTRELPDGSVEFTLPFGDPGEAARWILGHGPGYRPVAPPELVSRWKADLQELSDMAGGGSVERRITPPGRRKGSAGRGGDYGSS